MHIHEFQEMMKRLYFHRDYERGVKGTYCWLLDELEELGEALNGGDKEATEKSLQNIRKALWGRAGHRIYNRG